MPESADVETTAMQDHPVDPSASEQMPRFFRGLLLCYFVLCAALCGGAIALAGCASESQLPPGAIDFVTNAAQRVVVLVREARENSSDPATGSSGAEAGASSDVAGSEPSSNPTKPEDPATPTPASDVAGSHLVFRHGGFDGSKAAEDPATQIGAFKFSSSGMSYKWTAGDLGNWGLARTDAGALACAFYWSDKEQAWIGGKFDWISSSRLTRSWENVRERYNGWDPDAFFSAKRHAFCIVSKDGRRRTNLVED